MKEINRLKKLESIFAKNRYFGEFGKIVFSYVDRGSNVCLTAPHATKSTVYRLLKRSDLFTGSIAMYIGEKNHFSHIVRTRYLYKKSTIGSFIVKSKLENHYFLDIHAMKDRPFDLAVGIGYVAPEAYHKELSIIKKLCQKYHLTYVVNHPAYTGQPGLTGYLQRKLSRTTVLQLEWTKSFRDFNRYPDKVMTVTIPFITELAKSLNTLSKPKLRHKISTRHTVMQKFKNEINWLKWCWKRQL